MTPRVVAFDLSLTRTGCALPDGSLCSLTPPKASSSGMPRLAWIRAAVLDAAAGCGVVVLEGYSLGQARGSSRSHSLGELGGVVRLALYEAGLPYADVAPASLKRYATGRGNAGKEEVLAAAIRRLGYAGHDNNEADAAWLRTMALDHYGQPCAAIPARQREALAGVQWPEPGAGMAPNPGVSAQSPAQCSVTRCDSTQTVSLISRGAHGIG